MGKGVGGGLSLLSELYDSSHKHLKKRQQCLTLHILSTKLNHRYNSSHSLCMWVQTNYFPEHGQWCSVWSWACVLSCIDIAECSFFTVDDKRKAKNTAYILMDIIQEEGVYVFLNFYCDDWWIRWNLAYIYMYIYLFTYKMLSALWYKVAVFKELACH